MSVPQLIYNGRPGGLPYLGAGQEAYPTETACARARQRVRLASSILKLLWPRPTAYSIAASAAAQNVAMVAGRPTRIASASIERHGLCATPPKPTRAEVIVRSSIATIAATEMRAKAYDARSRTLR